MACTYREKCSFISSLVQNFDLLQYEPWVAVGQSKLLLIGLVDCTYCSMPSNQQDRSLRLTNLLSRLVATALLLLRLLDLHDLTLAICYGC